MYASFGHHIVNEGIYRWGVPIFGTYNAPQVVYDGVLQNSSGGRNFSDLYFEKASFLRVENITLRYPFKLKNRNKLIAFIGLNNPLTFHKYSGGNPEARLDLRGDGLFHGLDELATHPMTSSFVLGAEIYLIKKGL